MADTTGADGEPLDALVISSDGPSLAVGSSLGPIGVLWITYGDEDDGEIREAKIVAVPDRDPASAEVRDLADLPMDDVIRRLGEPHRGPADNGGDSDADHRLSSLRRRPQAVAREIDPERAAGRR